jgi:hypothetical protein
MIPTITSILEVMGNFDIICSFLFRDSADLHYLIDTTKTIKGVERIDWAEEIHQLELKNNGIFGGLWNKKPNLDISMLKESKKERISTGTKFFMNPQDSLEGSIGYLNAVKTDMIACGSMGAIKLIVETDVLNKSYTNLISRLKNNNLDGIIRWVTQIGNDKDNLKYVMKFKELGGEIIKQKSGHPTKGAYWFPAYNSSAGVKAMQFIKDQIDSGIKPQKKHYFGDEFANKKFAVMIEGSWMPSNWSNLTRQDIDKIGFIPMFPVPDSKSKNSTLMVGWLISIPMTSSNKDVV